MTTLEKYDWWGSGGKASIVNTLVKPTIPIPEDAIAIHGITDEMVKDAPNFCEVYPQIVAALAGKEVLIYNANFDIRILKRCCGLRASGIK